MVSKKGKRLLLYEAVAVTGVVSQDMGDSWGLLGWYFCLVVGMNLSSGSSGRSVDPRVRLAIARWPNDAPCGAVSSFCDQEGISRRTFYMLRVWARAGGRGSGH